MFTLELSSPVHWPNTGGVAYAAVKAMKNIFTENGIPRKVISDNGPHFSAGEF